MPKKLKIYFDYASTTPVDPRVIKAMIPFFDKKFGNPASLHFFGEQAKEALNEARQTIAQNLNAKTEEIIFTSSATESNNLALKGVALANQKKGNQIIISSIEHACVLESAKWLAKQGFKVDYLPVKKNGLVDLMALKRKISAKTILVSVMHANNEIGVIEPIEAIGKICQQKNIYFHTDASQTFGKIKIDVKKSNLDLLTASSHKIYGPKGVGLLYVKKGVKIDPILHGGGHEFGLRSSTVNVPGIIGFAQAVKIYKKERRAEENRLINLRDQLIQGVLTEIPGSRLTVQAQEKLYNIAHFLFQGIEGEAVVLMLSAFGISASTGSACASQKLEPSHVLMACGIKPQDAHGSLRISLGRWTTKKETDYFLEVLPKVIKKLRKISPI